MAQDEKPELSMPEFLDTLERGKRTYECFKYAIEIGKRLANHEQVERELLDRVTLANAAKDRVEASCKEVCARCDDEVATAKDRSRAIIESIKKEESATVDRVRSETTRQACALKTELHELSQMVAVRKAELDALARQSSDIVNEIRKLEKQLANAREAKNALLQA